MIRQQSHPQEGGRVAGMQGGSRPARVAMTAPRPRLQRLLSEDASSKGGSFDKEEDIIRKTLFAPPAVVQNEIFRMEMPANNHHHRQMIHQRRSTSNGGIQPILRTPPKQRLGRGTCSTVKRTGNDQFCGLTAEISREIAYRTPSKTPASKKQGNAVIMKTPVSRDLFRAKPSVPMTDSKLMNIQLAQTESLSSSDSGSSSPLDFPFMPSTKQQPSESKKREPMNVLDTPKTKPKKKQKIRKTPFPKMSGRKKLKRTLTPPRRNFGSHMKSTRANSAAAASLLSAMSTSYDGVNDFRLTSTEHDPAPFQVELPAKKEVLVHSMICAMMDGYTAIHRDFNFAMLSGVSRLTLEKEYEKSSKEKPMIAGSCHRDVVEKLLGCADDLVVEGFFRDYTDEGKDKESERMEACIFSSETLRQIIVCFRGSTANQAKPLKKETMFGKQAGTSILHEEQAVPILDTFRSVYFGTSLETTVFALLANLATRKPFFDIVMTGHSFGAAQATIASFRYASSNSQMRVSCHVFGSPRIGGEEWRQLVHSVPNLRIYRVENASDPYVLLPSGNEWTQCGHSIQITDNKPDAKVGVEFKARRFDRDSSASTHNNLLGYVQAKVFSQGTDQGKMDHEIQSYVEKLKRSGEQWFEDFCEVKGKGVSGDNNERRMLA